MIKDLKIKLEVWFGGSGGVCFRSLSRIFLKGLLAEGTLNYWIRLAEGTLNIG